MYHAMCTIRVPRLYPSFLVAGGGGLKFPTVRRRSDGGPRAGAPGVHAAWCAGGGPGSGGGVLLAGESGGERVDDLAGVHGGGA